MKKGKTYALSALLLSLVLAFAACGPAGGGGGQETKEKLAVSAVYTKVDEGEEIVVRNADPGETFTYSVSDDTVRIKDGKVYGNLAGAVATLTVNGSSGRTGTAAVEVEEDVYQSGLKADERSDPALFGEISLDPVENVPSDFGFGIDISTLKENIGHGAKYYNAEGIRQNVYQILRDSGVNYVRLRLWHDPYSGGAKVAYGAGVCDLETVSETAADAKAAGLKLLLDIHYSDFWADPGSQIVPKAWAGASSSDEMSTFITKYTAEVLRVLDAAGARPDSVQLGNETTAGILLHKPGSGDSVSAEGEPSYSTGKSGIGSAIAGSYGSANFVKYIGAANSAVKNFDANIQTMVHLAKGMSGIDFIKQYFHSLDSVDFDIIGLSYYPYYHGSAAQLKSAFDALAKEFPDKKLAVAEISYGFTYASDPYAANSFGKDNASGSARPVYGYEATPAGQARLLRDVIEAVSAAENGDGQKTAMGVFYWEGCWTPVAGVGWAGASSKNSWANQALFSYGGKALPSLSVMNLI